MEKPIQPNACSADMGTLPGHCAPLAFPYVPMQCEDPERYNQWDGLAAGTLFPGLNLPFFKAIKTRMNCENRALCELMALGFALTELALYLDTHCDDKEALRLYREYAALAEEGRKRYEATFGPLRKKNAGKKGSWDWIYGPWPWEYEGGQK